MKFKPVLIWNMESARTKSKHQCAYTNKLEFHYYRLYLFTAYPSCIAFFSLLRTLDSNDVN